MLQSPLCNFSSKTLTLANSLRISYNVFFLHRLTKPLTKFGRHSQNDYFLDSTEHMCLISRWHAEIKRVQNDDTVSFLLIDKGMNGTYVDDTRVEKSYCLNRSKSFYTLRIPYSLMRYYLAGRRHAPVKAW